MERIAFTQQSHRGVVLALKPPSQNPRSICDMSALDWGPTWGGTCIGRVNENPRQLVDPRR